MFDIARQMRDEARKQAKHMRNEARSTAAKRKEEYLGARVPKELREKVIAQADRLGISVSILIRDILEAAFSSAGENSSRSFQAKRVPEAEKGERKFPRVIAWENITLNRDANCSGCATSLKATDAAFIGFGAPGEDHVILCAKCKEHA